jgi:hypothetical protein
MSRVKKNVAASRALGTKMDRSAGKVVGGLRAAARSGRYRSAVTGRFVSSKSR